ncbi:MAG: hypothetical protein NTV81_04215 [Candidatus Komeilibacteria bacterium]|nr:hypothetical protein [Candidatus Komeilibacteria bacterium]
MATPAQADDPKRTERLMNRLTGKMITDEVTGDHLQWFLSLSKAERDQLSATGRVIDDNRFRQLTVFRLKMNNTQRRACRLDQLSFDRDLLRPPTGLTDARFASANELSAGQSYMVKIFELMATVSLADCRAFLKSQQAALAGPQGLALVYRNHRAQLQPDHLTVSLGEVSDSAADDQDQPVGLSGRANSKWQFSIVDSKGSLRSGIRLLCFCKNGNGSGR